jgi:hypothetical protein
MGARRRRVRGALPAKEKLIAVDGVDDMVAIAISREAQLSNP